MTTERHGIRLPSRRTFLLLVGLSALIYLLVFSLPYPLSQHYNQIPPVDYAKLSNYSLVGFVSYLVGLATLFILYLWALRLIMPKNGETARAVIGLRFVLVTGAALAAVLWLSYPLGAIDVFVYAVYTRGWALYGLNPLATAPAQYPASDPWLGLAAEWIDAPSPYGPVWQVLSLGAYYAGGGDFLRQVFALKISAIVAYLGCTILIYRLLQQIRSDWALAGTIAFAWNPLVLIEVAQNAHNDIVMIFFMLAAVWALTTPPRKHSPLVYDGLVCLFLALSVLTKFITIVVVPFFLLVLLSRGQRWPDRFARLLGFGSLLGALLVLGTWPLWPGWDTWAVVQGADAAGRSILALLVLTLRDVFTLSSAFDVARQVLLGLYVVIYGYAVWRVFKIIWHSKEDRSEALIQQTFASAFSALFWLLLLVMPIFHAWYLVWCFPLAVLLLPQRRLLQAAIVFSITALFII
ncbi:MAG TPA: glycosyltransferase family 39 protein, partial [Anaerolineae bacterium]|nr:glycosyltransferase family 39 protein [Anaerolineae bacterium]